MLTTAPRGTQDFLPGQIERWQNIEMVIRELCKLYHYREIRTPIFEHTELFLRGIGETTDVVEKEMYTFIDRGERSITLRPENTAAVVRAFLEHHLDKEAQPTKLFYIGPMFRYDRPQAGRYRQFHQFGVEAIGAPGPGIDAEIIALAMQLLERAGLTDLELHINTVGCPQCRPVYRQKLQDFLRNDINDLCTDCQNRFDRNPLRVLDCKNEQCRRVTKGAPTLLDCLCPECREHFDGLKTVLDQLHIPYQLDPRLVRGLDYYTKTAFEIQYLPLGAQSAICGGGRYDGLIQECGGPSTPGIGFAVGLERLLLAREKQQVPEKVYDGIDVYLAAVGSVAQLQAAGMVYDLRRRGVSADMDQLGRSLKAQMKFAAKIPARYVAILGDDEIIQQTVMLRSMADGSQSSITWQEFLSYVF